MARFKILQNRKHSRGQSIVEFAIALPVVLLIVFGVIELGFLLFTYSSVNSASREAARYGIAIGDVGSSQRYYDCPGIVEAGLRIGRFAGMDSSEIAISYDSGPGTTTKYTDCEDLASYNGDDSITFGDRIVIDVNHDYRPIVSYMGLNIAPFTMTSTSSRTIFKAAEVIPGGGDGPGSGGGGGGGGGGSCFTLTLNIDSGTGSTPLAAPSTSGEGCENLQYSAGTVVILTGQPGSGWYVGSWNGATPTSDTQATLTITGDTTVGVTYVSVPVVCSDVTTNKTGSGAPPVITSESSSCAGGQFAEGETVNLQADPDDGWVVTGWTNATPDAGDNTLASLTMPASNVTVTVDYAKTDCYGLDLQVGGDGTGGAVPVALTESTICGPGEYVEGEVVTLQALPDSGYEVDFWTNATENPLNNNQASFTMPAAVPTVSVTYKEETTLDPPSNLNVPNNFAAGDFGWTDSGGGRCTQIKFNYTDSMPPRGNWPKLPDYYNVHVTIYGPTGPSTSVYQVGGTQWSGASVGIGYDISFGVEGVFLSDPSDTSMYSEVTYRCLYQVLEFQGALIRGK